MTISPHEREKRVAIRNARIRRQLLSIAHAERGNASGGFVTARYLLDVLQASVMQDTAPDGDDHAAELVRDLVGARLLDDRDDREFTGDPFRLDTWSVRITPEGTALLAYATDPHPLVADPRPRK